ncbi:MAG: tetratricopeptide repeat protein [Smithella sp.]
MRKIIISILLVLTLFCSVAISATAADWFSQAQALWNNDQGKFTDPQKAIEYLNSAIQLQPNYAAAYNSRGNAYADLRQYRRAIEDYNQAIRLKPDYAYALINRGDAHYGLGRYKRTVEDCTEALRWKPDSPIAYSNRGKAYAQLKNYTSAMKDFNEALRLKPDYVDAFNNRAFAYLLQGNHHLGCLDAQKACDLGLCKVLQWAKSKGKCMQGKPGPPAKEEEKITPHHAPVSIIPEKKTPLPLENFTSPSTEEKNSRELKKIKGVELLNGKIIEGQIISLNAETVSIRTQDGTILTFSFPREVYRFVK